MILTVLHFAYGAAAIVALVWLIWSQLVYDCRRAECRRVIREHERASDMEATMSRLSDRDVRYRIGTMGNGDLVVTFAREDWQAWLENGGPDAEASA